MSCTCYFDQGRRASGGYLNFANSRASMETRQVGRGGACKLNWPLAFERLMRRVGQTGAKGRTNTHTPFRLKEKGENQGGNNNNAKLGMSRRRPLCVRSRRLCCSKSEREYWKRWRRRFNFRKGTKTFSQTKSHPCVAGFTHTHIGITRSVA